MKFSKPKIYRCPFCGALQRINSIMSGNTINKSVWSDYKVVLPMLPHVSDVLRCPICKKYHFYDESQIVGECNSWCNGSWGNLSYNSLMEAMEQLAPTGVDENKLRMMLLWAYNDLYWNTSDAENNTTDFILQREYFINNVKALIAINSDNRLFCAELYREIGEFDKCLDILNSIKKESAPIHNHLVVDILIEKAQNRDAKVFALLHGTNKEIRGSLVEEDETQYIYDPCDDPEACSIF